MAIKGLEQAVENLSRISRTAVPGAAAMAIRQYGKKQCARQLRFAGFAGLLLAVVGG